MKQPRIFLTLSIIILQCATQLHQHKDAKLVTQSGNYNKLKMDLNKSKLRKHHIKLKQFEG